MREQIKQLYLDNTMAGDRMDDASLETAIYMMSANYGGEDILLEAIECGCVVEILHRAL